MSDVSPHVPEGTGAAPEDGVPSGVWCESGSARAAIIAAVTRSVVQLDAELPCARAGDDPEGVHQARVAIRRLRSDLRTFAPLIDGDWVAEMRRDMRTLADALGTVRDNDVLGMRLRKAIVDVDVDTDATDLLCRELADQGRRARDLLLIELDDERTAHLLDRLRGACDDPPTTLAALGRAELRLIPLVRRPWRKLAHAVTALGQEPPVAELHRIRLLAKRVRYAAEAVEPAFGRRARRFASAVTSVQDVLGDQHDAEVAAEWLARTGPNLDAPSAFVAGQLAHHFDVVAAAHRHGWERSFERARRRASWLDD
jgi:CHAD domain-containing protein